MERFDRRSFLIVAGLAPLSLIIESGPSSKERRAFRWLKDVPPSLMLHSKNWRQIDALAPLLLKHFQPMTYKSWLTIVGEKEKFANHHPHPFFYESGVRRLARVSSFLEGGTPPVIVSIDDIGTDWIRHEHLQIFEDLLRHGIPGVIALQPNTPVEKRGPYWERIIELHRQGWEIATHTVSHPVLPGVLREKLEEEIKESADRIRRAVGEPPLTLILPFGSFLSGKTGEADLRIFEVCREVGIKVVAGIGEGRERTFFGQGLPEYVGRAHPGQTPDKTLENLLNF